MYKTTRHHIFALLTALIPIVANADDSVIAKLFAQENVEGTMVIESLKTGQTFVHNDARAKQLFSPASTFKVLNTLIAVQDGVVQNDRTVFKWDGHHYSVAQWNHDQTLDSAFKVSCVWCYQQIARKVGIDAYKRYIKQTDYGHLQNEFDVTTFWLDEGSLEISAFEQVDFLKKLVRHQLPFNEKAYDTLQTIMLMKKTPAYSLWAKTGWAARVQPNVGWYIGYVKTAQDTWLFAMNMRLDDKAQLPLRQKLTLEVLSAKGLIGS
ncbi:class D beta-lactamase [Thiomicrospira sp. XS5]|uniref:class D beta-lactamase n=1 Tax=Thiomicrospira sp. XS5 TaxID=1775636 RepID=UPI000746E72E|nr:class D beta-lactamase [Thiomicrospira sp. XS5]KUJ75212.1 class D beta-lactamase [Thiomicrospira sp. XS5]